MLRQALAHHQAGRLAEASGLYQQILAATPDHADVLYFLAVVAQQSGEHEKSVELVRRSLTIVPDQARCYTILGLGLMELGVAEEAETNFLRAIALDDSSDRYNNLGFFWQQQGRLDDAIGAYQQALARAPGDATVDANLGNVYRAKGNMEAAAEYFGRSVALRPDDAELHCDLGDALQTLGRFSDAVAAYQRSLGINPQLVRAWYAGACAQGARHEYSIAMAWFGKALEIVPDWPEAQHNLGQILFKLGQVDEALELFRRAASGSDLALPKAAIASIIPGSPVSDHQAILDARRAWAERQFPEPGLQKERSSRPARATDRPIRVGYVSSFFQDHNWMKPVWGLINHHDRRLFEVHLFSDAPASRIRHGYRPQPQDQFHDVSEMSNEALARQVEGAGIDLLVDLNGYSNMPRLPLFTLRPAPVIVGWFNMYATTGMSSYDFLIGDDVVIPPEEEKYYCEKILRVPGSYLTFEMTYPAPEVVDPPCIRNGTITFGSLSSQYKITNGVIESWSRILQQCPNGSLILKNRTLGAASARDIMHEGFERHGVSRERVHLRGPSDHYRFLEAYAEIDIALDTFPYNGGTTTTEAIWQGVPVVTFFGDRWVSRTSASILKSASLGDLIAKNIDDYISLAVRLANSPDYLMDIRRDMRPRLRDSAICDTVNFARNMERIYTSMISRAQ